MLFPVMFDIRSLRMLKLKRYKLVSHEAAPDKKIKHIHMNGSISEKGT